MDINCTDCDLCCGCLRGLNKEQLERLNSSAVRVSFKPGEIILKQGALASHIVHLTSGYARFYIETGDGKNLIVKILKPHEFAGITSLYANKQYAFSLAALGETQVCLFDKSVFLSLTNENSIFANVLNQWYCESHSQIFNKLKIFGSRQLHGRVADSLLYLADEVFRSDRFNLMLSRKEFAELAGTSKEGLIRILSEMRNDKIINLDDREVEIIKKDLLERIREIG